MKAFALKSAATAAALLASTGLAAAQVTATATADLNIRTGPGPQYPVVGVIGAAEETTINGCLEGSKWCQVSHAGVEGWAYSDYLTASFGTETIVLTERPAEAVPVVTYETTASTGPVATLGAAIGGVADAVVDAIVPPREVVTYVESNPIEPVYLEGEVVVGATLPEPVEFRTIPDYEYRYVYVNGQPVLVEPQSRRIVYVMR